MSELKCEPETREIPDKMGHEITFELWCSVHGKLADYSTLTVRQLGAKEVQRLVDRRWLTHAATIDN